MAESEVPTPYAEAMALKAAGAEAATIEARLASRGLDAEAIALLLNAVGVREVRGPLPSSGAPAAGPAAAPSVDPSVDPSVPALGPPPSSVCTRCGVFLDAWVPVLGKAYCTACGARPEVNYPRAYRDAHWGRRDGWAWFLGVTGLLGLGLGAIATGQDVGLGVPLVVGAVGSLLYWSGAQLGRPALVASMAIGALFALANGKPPNIVGIAVIIVAMRSVRSRLFFKLEVPEAELEAAWRAEHDNVVAVFSRALGFIALATMITWVGVREFAYVTVAMGGLAVLTGVIGLRNVKPDAQPPVGRKGAAFLGVVTGALAMLAAALFLVF